MSKTKVKLKGYKIFNSDWTCKGFQYEVGETYEIEGKPELCKHGFHFCTRLKDCFKYYPCVTWNHIAEVEALDIEWDEYETHCIDSEYSNIINLVEEALKERSSEDCRYDR